MKYETNTFRIENLSELTSAYSLFELHGLNNTDDDYDVNIQYIIKSLSFKLKHPATIIHKEKQPFLVIRQDEGILKKVPAEYHVKKDNIVYFKKVDNSFDLDFKNYTEQTKGIIIRFLQFDIQAELNKNANLWQPGSGEAFFSRNSNHGNETVAVYNGFLARVNELTGGGFGVCIDVTQKYVARHPLNAQLTRLEFKKQQVDKSHFVFSYGSKQYEIKPKEFSDLNISQYKFKRKTDGRVVTLLEDIRGQYGTSMPPHVAKLPDNAAAIIYQTNNNEERRVPAGLCYRVFDTEEKAVKQLHRESILPPFYRRRFIRIVAAKYLSKLMYGDIKLKVTLAPLQVEKKKFIIPDIMFGNGKVVSIRNLDEALATDISRLGRVRKDLLFDKDAGCYTRATFERQLFIVPETDYHMYANEKYFLKHLEFMVNKSHPTEAGWKPEVITYDNRNKTTSVEIGFEIMDKVAEYIKMKKGGYAVIMLPSDVQKNKRQHDELAALVVSQCFEEHEITAGIMHNEMLAKCFYHETVGNETRYAIKQDLRKKYQSYLEGVAINQVLLNNERWPFILNTPLHADLTIGIDVKRNIAGFTFIDKYSRHILTRFDKSSSKEKLSTAQVVRMLTNFIKVQANYADYKFNRIVIHRDGRLFNTEKMGIQKAIEILIQKGVIPENADVTIVEIPKHAVIPYRMFEATGNYDVLAVADDNGHTLNPEIGSWEKLNDREAFLCTTGREFTRDGTSNPLFVKIESGPMPVEEILEDIFFLSCLPYTRPEDCSRFPLTIKITDRRINNMGSGFDFEALEILKSENLKL
jgi:hypothetical protein